MTDQLVLPTTPSRNAAAGSGQRPCPWAREALARYAGPRAGRVAIPNGAGTGIGRASALDPAGAGRDESVLGRRRAPEDLLLAPRDRPVQPWA